MPRSVGNAFEASHETMVILLENWLQQYSLKSSKENSNTSFQFAAYEDAADLLIRHDMEFLKLSYTFQLKREKNSAEYVRDHIICPLLFTCRYLGQIISTENITTNVESKIVQKLRSNPIEDLDFTTFGIINQYYASEANTSSDPNTSSEPTHVEPGSGSDSSLDIVQDTSFISQEELSKKLTFSSSDSLSQGLHLYFEDNDSEKSPVKTVEQAKKRKKSTKGSKPKKQFV